MRLIAVLACLLVSALSLAQEAPQKKKVFFAWLVTGDGKRPAEREELMKMQEAHLANFKKQHGLGNLIGAGPVQDPGTKRRGIVVLTVPDAKAVPPLFREDPYVANRIMTLDYDEWHLGPTKLNSELPEAAAIEENRIFVLTAEEPLPAEDLATVEAKTANLGKIGVGGWVGKPGKRAVFLLQGKEAASLEATAKELERPGLKVEVFTLWMAKGALPTR
jgi:uncharacterized protein YciI